MENSLADRMKAYEDNYRPYFDKDANVIIRIDGSNFSNLTKNLKKPFDQEFIDLMNDTARYVVENVSGFRFGTVQSDEINLCLQTSHQYQDAYYKNNINKINSLCASFASSYFSVNSNKVFGESKPIQFDARCFVLPKEEIVNYFIYRQNDTMRNAVQMTARTYFTNKEVHGKDSDAMKKMVAGIGKPFEGLPMGFRNGRAIYKTLIEKSCEYNGELVQRKVIVIDKETPIFVSNKEFVERHLV